MIYRRRPYTVEASHLANGNWLVEHGGDREVWRPEDFDAAFEVVTRPAYVCPRCHDELIYDIGVQALVCRRC